jgi:hypothetical protein
MAAVRFAAALILDELGWNTKMLIRPAQTLAGGVKVKSRWRLMVSLWESPVCSNSSNFGDSSDFQIIVRLI